MQQHSLKLSSSTESDLRIFSIRISVRLRPSITVFADEYGMQRSEIIVLSDASDFGMDYIDSNTLYGYIDHRINVDAPATKQELQTFFLGWERWRNASGGPRALIRRANSSFERTLAAIEALGMRDPALAVNPGVHDDTNQSHHQAMLDIACVIAAMQRDERPVATIAQLCDGFRERTTQKQASRVSVLPLVIPQGSWVRSLRTGCR